MEPLTWAGIIIRILWQFMPVWIALVATFALSITYKRSLGLYGKLFDSTIGMIGFGIVMFWVFTGLFAGADLIATHDPLTQMSGMKNKLPGTPVTSSEAGLYPYYLLGGDNLARDVFSRMVIGATEVLKIAPLATIFAFMVGITLGLPAGYFTGPALRRFSPAMWIATVLGVALAALAFAYGGSLNGVVVAIAAVLVVVLLHATSIDTGLSFVANLVLAFPVILLFYLLVTPEIVQTGIPSFMAAVLFVFPIVFFAVLFNSRYHTQRAKQLAYVGATLVIGIFLYLCLISTPGTIFDFMPRSVDIIAMGPNLLVVFVSVVFVNSPTVFRIVRGLVLDIRTRDYVAAGQTRGEMPWYIMLWEILPNARGPLIVDFCLRIGYTTILLGTLGFFGLGVSPESPDWGSTINEGRKLLSIYPHPALPPALALMSLVLGLNLLADGLREESLRD